MIGPRPRRRTARLCAMLGLAALLLTPLACGPVAIGTGIAKLAEDDSSVVQTVFVLILSNPTGEILEFSVNGVARSGKTIDVDAVMVAPGGVTQLSIPPADQVRVRGCERLDASTTRAPVHWDFEADNLAAVNALNLDVESVLMSSLKANASVGEALDVQRLDSDPAQTQFQFTALACTEYGFQPGAVFVHPSGAYAYTLQDLGGQRVELRAFRVAANSRALEFIAPEPGSNPLNPIQFAYNNSIDDLSMVFDPLARFAYVLDGDATNFRSEVQVFHLQEDGSLRPGQATAFGLLTSVTFSARGDFAYLYEDLGGALNAFQAYQVDTNTGLFNLRTSQDPGSCVNVDAPFLAVDPASRFAYAATQDLTAAIVRLGVYEIDASGSFALVQTVCTAFDQVFDLSIEPSGRFLYATGVETLSGQQRVIRYDIDLVTGVLGTQANQDLGVLSNLTSGADPDLPSNNAFRNIVYVAVGDTLVPNSRDGSTGALATLPGAPSLGFGSPTSTDLVEHRLSGAVSIVRQ